MTERKEKKSNKRTFTEPTSTLIAKTKDIEDTEGIEHIHFHLDYLSKLVLGIASAIDKIDGRLPLNPPRKWWIEG